MTKIIRNTKFRLDPFADGGSKRSVQIQQLYQENNLLNEGDDFVLPKGLKLTRLIILSLRAIKFIHRYYPKRIGGIRKYITLIKYYALRLPVVMDKYIDQDVVFSWENTTDRDLLYLLKATGKRVIALPHNIESLVRSHSIIGLNDEVENLKHCDVVFTIAKEEAWLLRLLGLNAHYLPYYPPQEAVVYFERIRKQRELLQHKAQKHFLLLGSATNTPTRAGMQSLIDFFTSKDFNYQISVAGYGTESLRQIAHPNMVYRGTLTNDELEDLLVHVDALLIYQPPTTGSLTRIPEMLIAGVPIFVNFDAARDYHHVEDVMMYNSLEELFARLNDFTPHMAKYWVRDAEAEKEFVRIITSV